MKRLPLSILCATILFFGLNLLLPATSSWAQFPNRNINLSVGFSAGGIVDMSTRALAEPASKKLGQPIVVLNKVGGGGSVCLVSLKGEKPDGYSLSTLSRGGILNTLMRKMPYDVVQDFTPIMTFSDSYGGVVVKSDSRWKTFKELIDYAKSNPGKIRFGTAGVGLTHHLAMERLALQERIKWTHIPFKGATQVIPGVLGGHVEVAATSPDFVPHVKSGRLRLLSTYSPTHLPGFPDAPTWLELGYNISVRVVTSIVGPKGLPGPVVDKLHGAFKNGSEDPNFKKIMQNYGAEVYYLGPEETGKDIIDFRDQWGKVIKQIGLKMEKPE